MKINSKLKTKGTQNFIKANVKYFQFKVQYVIYV